MQELGLAAAKQPLPTQCAINLINGLSVLISLLWTVFHSEVCVNHFYEWCLQTLTEFINSSYFKGLHNKVLFQGMCNNTTWSLNINYLQVAIVTPEGSWGYPYIKISFQITHPAQKGCPHHRNLCPLALLFMNSGVGSFQLSVYISPEPDWWKCCEMGWSSVYGFLSVS